MGRSSLPIVLVLVFVAALLAIALPQLFELVTSIQASTTGVSAPLSGLLGPIPIVLFILAAGVFTAILTVAVRR